MEILNFGQLSLAAEKDKLTLYYVVMNGNGNKIKRIGTIPPSDYHQCRLINIGGHGYIDILPKYGLGKTVTWRAYSNVMRFYLGLDILYLGISKELTLNKVKKELENMDEGIKEELDELKNSHKDILSSLKKIKAEMEDGK